MCRGRTSGVACAAPVPNRPLGGGGRKQVRADATLEAVMAVRSRMSRPGGGWFVPAFRSFAWPPRGRRADQVNPPASPECASGRVTLRNRRVQGLQLPAMHMRAMGQDQLAADSAPLPSMRPAAPSPLHRSRCAYSFTCPGTSESLRPWGRDIYSLERISVRRETVRANSNASVPSAPT